MPKMVLAFRGINVNASHDDATQGFLDYVVQNDILKSDEHIALLGLLAHSKLIVSNEGGRLTVSVKSAESDDTNVTQS